jgi:hypothetical protein
LGDWKVDLPPNQTDVGFIRVTSGATGAELRSYYGTEKDARLGIAVAGVGDMDGDGVPDYAGSGAVGDFPYGDDSFVWSGADGSLLTAWYAFDKASPLGDIDADGFDDLLYWSVVLLGGSFETWNDAYVGPDPGFPPHDDPYFDRSFPLGDIDGDGVADVAQGAPTDGKNEPCTLGNMHVFSGATGTWLYYIHGESVNSLLGIAAASLGDVTGDGLGDFIVSAPRCCCMCTDCCCPCPGLCDENRGYGRLSVHDGLTGARVAHLDSGFPAADFGSVMTAVGDVNGNGFGDVLLQFTDYSVAFPTPRNKLIALDGRLLTEIYRVPDPPMYQYFYLVSEPAAIGDIDSDDFPDFALPVAAGSPNDRVEVYSGAPIGVRAFGSGCSSTREAPPRIGASGIPRIGTRFTSYLSRVEPGLPAALLVGQSNTAWNGFDLPLDLGTFGLPGCLLLVAPTQSILTKSTYLRAREGVAEASFPIPVDPALVGQSIYLQWVARQTRGYPHDPNWAFTRGLEVTFQPLAPARPATPGRDGVDGVQAGPAGPDRSPTEWQRTASLRRAPLSPDEVHHGLEVHHQLVEQIRDARLPLQREP